MPTPVNCVAGPTAIAACGSDNSSTDTSGYFIGKMDELGRPWDLNTPGGTTWKPGQILTFGCSNTNYITPDYLNPIGNTGPNPYGPIMGCWGTSIRHLGRLLHNWRINGMCQQAGAIVIYGYFQNWISQEMNGRSDTAVFGAGGNVDYILGAVANMLSGPLVVVNCMPVIDHGMLTNGRVDSMNLKIQAIFGNKSNTKIVDANTPFKLNGVFNPAYSMNPAATNPPELHPNKAALDIIWHGVGGVNAKLAELGVI